MEEPTNVTSTEDDTSSTDPNVEELAQQLEQKEKDIQYLKDKSSARIQELLEQQKSLGDKVANFEGRLDEKDRIAQQNATPAVDPYELTEEQRDKFIDNPSSMLEFMKVRESEIKARQDESVDLIIDAIRARDALHNESLAEIKGEISSRFDKVDPEKAPWREAITELKEVDEFSKLDDNTLIAIAKAKDMKPAMEYRGSAGGQRTRESSQEKKAVEFSPEVSGYALIMKLAEGNAEKADSIWKRMEARRIA